MIIIFIYIIGGKQDHDTRVENDCRDQADNEQTYESLILDDIILITVLELVELLFDRAETPYEGREKYDLSQDV